MPVLKIDALLTVSIAFLVLLLGAYIQKKVTPLKRFFIPAPVIGGLLFSIILSFLSYFEIVVFKFDTSAQRIFMVVFFATIGFSASLRFLYASGKVVIILFLSLCLLVCLQNFLGISLAHMLGHTSAFGLANGSITMVGGHGTGVAFSEILEHEFNLQCAATITATAATFGLISGSLLGGPIARHLMKLKHFNLKPEKDAVHPDVEKSDEDRTISICKHGIFNAITVIAIAIGIGELLSSWIKSYGVILPEYIGAMFVAALLRNVSDFSNVFEIKHNELQIIGAIFLSLFLAMALMQIQLLLLAKLAFSMLIILMAQIILVILFARFVIFNALGRNYDAVVMSCGCVGLGLGATPNAIANMEAFTAKNYPAPQAFFAVPIAGSVLIDFFNAGTITTLLNFF